MALRAIALSASAIGALEYQGTWNASTNTPTLTSGTGTKGAYYVVSVAGSTNLDGETLWGVGDWAVFNGTAWQKVDGGDTGTFTTISVSGNATMSALTASAPVFTDASKVLTSTGTVPIASGGTNQTTYTAPSGTVKGLIYYDGTSFANDTTVTDEGYDTTNNNLVSRGYALSSAGIITESTTSRILSAADNGKVIYCTNGSTTTITTAASLGAGFSCTIVQGGAGKVTVAQGASTTLVSYSSLFSTMGQYAVISLIAPVADTFVAAGNLGV